jgi:DNA-directed RNA polymerase
MKRLLCRFTNTGFFSYQQSELARSLLLFKNGHIVTPAGLDRIKIYTANCFGLDKKSQTKRIE